MAVISIDTFADLTARWSAGHDNYFKRLWPVKGGWEGWIQVDLTAFVLQCNDTVDILREQRIYRNERQATDLLINASSAAPSVFPVEIKAQSFENRDRFAADANAHRSEVHHRAAEQS